MFKYPLVYFCIVFLTSYGSYAEKCEKVFGRGVSEQEKKTIVDTHNELRKLVANGKLPGQPRAVNLKRLKWDDKLAAQAQKVSDTCTFRHVRVNDSRWPVGQNLYTSSSTAQVGTADWRAAIQAWFDENKDFNFGGISNGVVGHYTQVVWANTEYIGCGYTSYEDSTATYKYNKLYTCNYGPAGNYVGQDPYKKGTSGCEDLC